MPFTDMKTEGGINLAEEGDREFCFDHVNFEMKISGRKFAVLWKRQGGNKNVVFLVIMELGEITQGERASK